MSDDRASRLRERRRSSKARADRPDDEGPTDESDGTDAGDGGSESTEGRNEAVDGESTDETAGSRPQAAVPESSVKDEQVGTYMYLPERQKRELSRVFNVAKAEYEFDEEFEKNRHFYPLLVQFGLERLEDASPAELRELLADLERV